MRKRLERRLLTGILTGGLLFAGSFLIGMGTEVLVSERQVRQEYETSALKWKQELAQGIDSQKVRDTRNREILENRKYITIAGEIVLESAKDVGEVRIGNDDTSIFGCVMIIIRDATGETIYESGLIEPGHYIEYAVFDGKMEAGYHSCTAVGSFYTEAGEYAGEAAWKVAVIIKN